MVASAAAARRRPRTALGALGLALALTACSGSDTPDDRPVVTGLTPSTPYEKAVVADGATALWSLRDATSLRASDEVADLTAGKASATVVGGTITQTVGPDGSVSAKFFRSGRLVTPVTTGLTSTDAFSLELGLRADACVDAWGRVLGTTGLRKGAREGFELIHFPRTFATNPCRFGVEFWHLGRHLGGCHPKPAPVNGVWTQWSVVYAKGRVTCYQNGAPFETTVLAAPRAFDQIGPLGIGGSGSGFQGPLDGASLSEVAFYKRALTPAEVAQHARLARQRATPSPSSS